MNDKSVLLGYLENENSRLVNHVFCIIKRYIYMSPNALKIT